MSLSHKSLIPGRNLGVSYLADVQMHEVRDTVSMWFCPGFFIGLVAQLLLEEKKNLIS